VGKRYHINHSGGFELNFAKLLRDGVWLVRLQTVLRQQVWRGSQTGPGDMNGYEGGGFMGF